MSTTTPQKRQRNREAPPLLETIPTAQGMPPREPHSWHTFPLGSKWFARFALALLALVPFHGFLTVFATNFGISYTVARLWTLAVLGAMSILAAYWLFRDAPLRHRLFTDYMPKVAFVYAVLVLVWAIRGVVLGSVGLPAAILGIFLDLRYIVFFLLIYMLSKYQHSLERRWLWVVLAGGIIVSVFAVLQYTVLPHDILTHVGYSAATIDPVETINDTPGYVRVFSFLRGPNALGAYLVVISTLLVVLRRWWARRLVWALALSVSLGALLFSFSRSAWIGTAVALGVIVVLHLRTKRQWYYALGLGVVGLIILMGLYGVTRHNIAVQNTLYHTSDASTARTSSNSQRLLAWRTAAKAVIRQPFGNGVGSAGPASVHNTKAPTKISENYYLQVAQETGWAGFLVYAMLLIAVAVTLWRQRDDTLSRALFASLLGLLVVSLFSHAWSDESLAFTWWGLAGLAIGQRVWRPLKP